MFWKGVAVGYMVILVWVIHGLLESIDNANQVVMSKVLCVKAGYKR